MIHSGWKEKGRLTLDLFVYMWIKLHARFVFCCLYGFTTETLSQSLLLMLLILYGSVIQKFLFPCFYFRLTICWIICPQQILLDLELVYRPRKVGIKKKQMSLRSPVTAKCDLFYGCSKSLFGSAVFLLFCFAWICAILLWFCQFIWFIPIICSIRCALRFDESKLI